MKSIIFLTMFLFMAIIAIPVQAGELDGESLFEDLCGSCHELERSLSITKTLEEWQTINKRMVEKSEGDITEEEADAIAKYLAERE